VVELREGSDSLSMASQADAALYRAKGAGRNRIQAERASKQMATFLSDLTDTVTSL
jgi:hypothetical protein